MADLLQSAVLVKVRSQQGRRKFRTAVVTADGSGTTIPALLLDMNYIDHAILTASTTLSDATDWNVLAAFGATTTLTLSATGSSGMTYDLQAWGW